MPKATLITMAALGGLLAMTGCRDRSDAPKPVRRTTIISAPGATSQGRPAKSATPVKPAPPKPAMSNPPPQNAAPRPATKPATPPPPSNRARDQYRDRCGRPLIT